jgi:Ca2+-binding RTX toxin-like protein
LQVQNLSGSVIDTINSFSLTFLGDNATSVQSPLVFTPEFASLAQASPSRATIVPGKATTIDLIALPNATSLNLNGGSGTIDGVAVTLSGSLKNANADGSLGTVYLTGLTSGGSELTGGDGQSTLVGSGDDTINAGLGTTTINTGAGGSTVTFSSVAASVVTMTSGGGDIIHAGLATATITLTGSRGDTILDQSAKLTFINGSGASTLSMGTGTVYVQAGAGGGTYTAGTGGGSKLTAGSGVVTFHGEANGDVLTAAGSGADTLVAGSGSETLSGGTSTGSITLQAGSGADAMTAGLGDTTFIVGKGNSSIGIGGLADLIEVVKGSGGGLDTVTGYRVGTDHLHLSGFLPSAPSSAVSGQTSDGKGGDMVALSDNTRLDLLGVSKISLSDFV